MVYTHGGGTIGGFAKTTTAYTSYLADTADIVVFNVEFRRVPESSAEDFSMDVYATTKYIIENADELGVDPEKIMLAGDSSGGLVTLSAAAQFAKRDESNLIKFIMPNDPKMLGHYLVTPFEDQDILERGLSFDTRFAALHASGHTEASLQKALDEGDPLVFPELADPKVLAKFPPVVMIEGEFDKYVTPAS